MLLGRGLQQRHIFFAIMVFLFMYLHLSYQHCLGIHIKVVGAAFPSVARDCLARKMRKIGIDKCLVEWMLDFMTDRRVRMVVDGQEGQELSVMTGLAQGSPASPILFAIYMHDLHKYVERRFRGITSFHSSTTLTGSINSASSRRSPNGSGTSLGPASGGRKTTL